MVNHCESLHTTFPHITPPFDTICIHVCLKLFQYVSIHLMGVWRWAFASDVWCGLHLIHPHSISFFEVFKLVDPITWPSFPGSARTQENWLTKQPVWLKPCAKSTKLIHHESWQFYNVLYSSHMWYKSSVIFSCFVHVCIIGNSLTQFDQFGWSVFHCC